MQLDVGSEPTFKLAYVTCINLNFGKVSIYDLMEALGPILEHLDALKWRGTP